jgi:probable F420-dependent oxidoreductase
VSVQANPRDRESWVRLATKVEAVGFDGLYVGDHPGSGASPFVALAAAAGVTERIQLGTCVVNAGMWTPMALASEVATLDVVSGGRAILGVGAGHTPGEWTSTGRTFPSAADRVDRMIELVEATEALLAGRPVSHEGAHFVLADALLGEPRPVQQRIPLAVGGNGTRVLRVAARHADIVGITGLGRTLADGHRHDVDWSTAGVRRIVELVDGSVTGEGRRPQIEVLVQHVEITDDCRRAAQRLADHVPGASVEDLLMAPFVWIGTVEAIRDSLQRHARELGIRRYVVRAPAVDAAHDVVDGMW